jgi:hypothetical protein
MATARVGIMLGISHFPIDANGTGTALSAHGRSDVTPSLPVGVVLA